MKYLDGRYASLYGHYFYVYGLDIETFDSIRHFFEIKEVSDDFVARNRAKLIEASEGYRMSFAINGYIAVLSQNNVADAIWKQDSACKCLCESGIRTLKCKNCPLQKAEDDFIEGWRIASKWNHDPDGIAIPIHSEKSEKVSRYNKSGYLIDGDRTQTFISKKSDKKSTRAKHCPWANDDVKIIRKGKEGV